ncbi:MAG: L-histidine N(alpha)-methyltransferase [Herbaspirillum sp.]
MAELIQQARYAPDTVTQEVIAGLCLDTACVAPKYLYDTLGSRLFEAICALPEYYPTRTEAAIFAAHATEIAQRSGHGTTLIDLGAGNCAKAARLFPTLQPTQYVALDIATDFLHDAVARLQQRFPAIAMAGVGMDFSNELRLPALVGADRRLFFYPGSSIGNFSPLAALKFLRHVRVACDDAGGILISVDLVKDTAILDAAYDDALGVTAAFNLNLLRHLNRVAGTDFKVTDWRHRGFFNPAQSRIEMHLEARSKVVVHWLDGERCFTAGERIHTENSYKYTQQGFTDLLRQAGFGDVKTWTDPQDWFMVCHARAG